MYIYHIYVYVYIFIYYDFNKKSLFEVITFT